VVFAAAGDCFEQPGKIRQPATTQTTTGETREMDFFIMPTRIVPAQT
jgi:hypothetical protein